MNRAIKKFSILNKDITDIHSSSVLNTVFMKIEWIYSKKSLIFRIFKKSKFLIIINRAIEENILL